MLAVTMPLLTIHHKTEYRYTHPVAFGEHRIMLRPRDSHDLRVLSGSLEIAPQPMSLRWIHDVFGNSVAIATFDERAETLSISSTATVEHNPALQPAARAWQTAYAGAAQARAFRDHRGAAALGGIHYGRRQLRRDSVRARH